MLIEGPVLAEERETVGKIRIADQPALSRTMDRESADPALIGPHAVIHAVAVMRERLNADICKAVLADAQITDLPSGECMVPELDALRLHRWLALRLPVDCFAIAEEAARRTGDYIIANRIPAPVVWLLERLPAPVAARMLMSAIRRHAWTFVGAGGFAPQGSWAFTIDRSHAGDPVMLPDSLFHWYAAVFERLYRRLVHPDCRCRIDPDSAQAVHRYTIARVSG
jgi:divinyl protochlorophyllide a 8-vinyl-reductase